MIWLSWSRAVEGLPVWIDFRDGPFVDVPWKFEIHFCMLCDMLSELSIRHISIKALNLENGPIPLRAAFLGGAEENFVDNLLSILGTRRHHSAAGVQAANSRFQL